MPDSLDKYRKKRDAGATAEPFGSGEAPSPTASALGGVFVVQMHAASRLHWDLRLEMDGVLHSWAIPRGPSLDPADKRLAMEVEDHPLEYADFEGVIPAGNYGAGSMIVWDRGRWVYLDDPDYPGGLAGGKLLFDLWGHKLRGRFTLVKTKGKGRAPNEWLLIKKPDGYARKGPAPPDVSILTGRTVEDVAAGRTPGDAVRTALGLANVPRRPVRAVDIANDGLMLAEPREAPPTQGKNGGAPWVWEIKYDGFRLVAGKQAGRVSLRYRRGSEVAERYPEIAAAVAALPYGELVLDGELVVHDDQGRPSFGDLQQRAMLSKPLEIKHAALRWPASYMVFDLLGFEGHDLRGLPLVERKKMLAQVVPPAGTIKYLEHLEGDGATIFQHVVGLGLEGIIGKRADSKYVAGRGTGWIKLKREQTIDLAVVGWSAPEGLRSGFGGLQLAYHDPQTPKGWVYAGSVGSGFDEKLLLETRRRLDELKKQAGKDAPVERPPPDRTVTWVEPKLVAEVRYSEWTHEQTLRQPVFLRFRDDKLATDCTEGPHREAPIVVAPREPEKPAPAPAPVAVPPPDQLQLTNLKKVFWPDAGDGYTKGDLIDYYREVAPWILPFLRDRPLVLTRFPDGIHGKSFFQQDAPGHIPTWIRTETMYSSETGKETRFIIADDVSTLVYVANLGTIPLHVWSSRVGSLQAPDWTILDLDPKGAPFSQVITVAHALGDLCRELGLPCFVKTSGKSGLHVLVPLGRLLTFDQGRDLALLLARVVCDQMPDLATLQRVIGKRGGRVYIDCFQNGHGKLLVAPLCVRDVPGAPVSTPLSWEEVNDDLDPGRFTIKTVIARLRSQKVSPWADLLESPPDLLGALGKLQTKLTTK